MQAFFDSLFGVPGITEIISQVASIIGMVIMVLSFQCKSNKLFFLVQCAGSLMFVINFLLIDAYGGALFNLVGLIRGLLFSKQSNKLWKLITVEVLYAASFVVSCFLDSDPWKIILTAIPLVGLLVISVFMSRGNSKHIRIVQISLGSPTWIVHNIFNLSIGGIICECFNMVSSAIFLYRPKKEETAA